MIIFNREISTTLQLQIGSDILSQVSSFKYLGVQIDSNLKFQSQMKILKGKLSRFYGISYRIKNSLDHKSTIKIYNSCMYSVLSYCIGTWGGVLFCSQRASCLIRLQQKIINNLFSKFYPRSTNILRDAKMLKLPDIYRLRVSLY